MGRIKDAMKYESKFKELWQTRDPEVKLEWLISEGFTEGYEYSIKDWNEIKRAMRQRWRALLNEYVRNVQQHKGRWTSMSKYDKGYYIVGGSNLSLNMRKRKMSSIGGSRFTVADSVNGQERKNAL